MIKKIKFSLYPLMVILTYLFCVIRLSYVSNINVYALGISSMIFLYLIIKGAFINNYKYGKVNLCLYIFCIFAIFSSIINMKNIDGTILFVLKIVDITLLVEYVSEIGKDISTSKILFFISFIMTIITIWFDTIHPYYAWKNDLNFFIGTKFSVSYNAIAMLLFFTYGFKKNRKKKIFYIMFFLLSIISLNACKQVDCMTGIIGNLICIAYVIYDALKSKKKEINRNLFMNYNTAISILIISAISVLVLEKAVSIPIINNFITETLQTSSDLSGRLIVYEKYPSYLKNHILFGYGYNNIYSIFYNTMKIRSNAYAYDSQNALLEYILYFGLIGTISFLVFVRNSFKRYGGLLLEEVQNKKIFVVGFYLLVIMGIVEITIDPLFYLFLAFIFSGNNNLNNKEKNNEIK